MSLSFRVALSFAFRFSCYGLALWLMLHAEARPAPTLPDAVLDWVPYLGVVDRYNYWLWLAAYLPIALALLRADGERFIRYMVSAGLLALLRALCVLATGLGPVHGADLNAGMSDQARSEAFWHLANPFGFFSASGAGVYLTKDLFFSGHTSTTFLLLLYVWKMRRLRWVMLVMHAVVVASVFLSHLHYTIDVIGAYAITLSLFVLRERSFAELTR